jgi:hypothetical protein
VDERGNVVGVVSGKLNPKAALVTSGSLPENVNYAVKSSFGGKKGSNLKGVLPKR